MLVTSQHWDRVTPASMSQRLTVWSGDLDKNILSQFEKLEHKNRMQKSRKGLQDYAYPSTDLRFVECAIVDSFVDVISD